MWKWRESVWEDDGESKKNELLNIIQVRYTYVWKYQKELWFV